jgi:hypothetical protein
VWWAGGLADGMCRSALRAGLVPKSWFGAEAKPGARAAVSQRACTGCLGCMPVVGPTARRQEVREVQGALARQEVSCVAAWLAGAWLAGAWWSAVAVGG